MRVMAPVRIRISFARRKVVYTKFPQGLGYKSEVEGGESVRVKREVMRQENSTRVTVSLGMRKRLA